MKVQEVINRVRSISGDMTALQYTDDQIVDWINDGIRECAVDNNLLQKRGTVKTVLQQNTYPMPTDVLKLYSIKWNGIKLEAMTMQEFDEQFGATGSDVGTPSVWYVWANQLTLYPSPESVGDLQIDYIYNPLPHRLDNIKFEELNLPVGYHSRIVDYCLAQVAQQDDNMTIYNIKMTEFRTGVQQLKDQLKSEDDVYPSISVDARDMGDASGYGDWY